MCRIRGMKTFYTKVKGKFKKALQNQANVSVDPPEETATVSDDDVTSPSRHRMVGMMDSDSLKEKTG
ncbi:hypothetical protein Tco_1362262 [Tanacetum coccineum]